MGAYVTAAQETIQRRIVDIHTVLSNNHQMCQSGYFEANVYIPKAYFDEFLTSGVAGI
jgi:hypothetical protein